MRSKHAETQFQQDEMKWERDLEKAGAQRKGICSGVICKVHLLFSGDICVYSVDDSLRGSTAVIVGYYDRLSTGALPVLE